MESIKQEMDNLDEQSKDLREENFDLWFEKSNNADLEQALVDYEEELPKLNEAWTKENQNFKSGFDPFGARIAGRISDLQSRIQKIKDKLGK